MPPRLLLLTTYGDICKLKVSACYDLCYDPTS
jgi:hypothetical protein